LGEYATNGVIPVAIKGNKETTFDRLPPQNLDAERAVLGAMLLNPDAVGIAVELLHSDSHQLFYAPAHQYIYEAIVALYGQAKPIDGVTLKDQLDRSGNLEGAGGLAYIGELTGSVPTSANIEHYARIVLDASLLRRLISTCTSVVTEAYDTPEDVNKLLDKAEGGIFTIAEQRQLNPVMKISDLLEDSIHRIEAQMKAGSGITGVATGIKKLDEMTSGFQPSDMVVLAARPSVGKTALALNMASHAAIQNGKNVLLFSLEMAKEQLVQRLLCIEGQIDSSKLRTGYLAGAEFPKLTKAAATLDKASIYIDDTPNISVLDLRSKARKHMAANGCDMLIIDYLQLMVGSGRSESRQVEIAEISRSIKGLARELRVPVIALSQLSREADKDDSGGPKLSHLRESGAIEQDADVVMMLSRPPAHEMEGLPDTIHLNVVKQRNGPTGNLDLIFDKTTQKFKNLVDGGFVAEEAPPQDYSAYDNAEEEYEEGDDVPF
jgi:replicative DNA helicase